MCLTGLLHPPRPLPPHTKISIFTFSSKLFRRSWPLGLRLWAPNKIYTKINAFKESLIALFRLYRQ